MLGVRRLQVHKFVAQAGVQGSSSGSIKLYHHLR